MEFWEDYEVVEIETPELLTLQLPLAGFGPRALAFFVDSIAISVAQFVIGALLVAIGVAMSVFDNLGSGGAPSGSGLAMLILFVLIILLVYPAYFILFESIWNGQTPGKRLTGIRVVMRGGLPLNSQAIWMRNLMRLVDMLPSNHFAGIIAFFATNSQQRVGDLVADTIVVREFSANQPVSWVQSYSHVPAAQRETGMVTPRMALAINQYLSRAVNFSPELRHRLSGHLINALGYSADSYSQGQRDEYLASVLASFHSQA